MFRIAIFSLLLFLCFIATEFESFGAEKNEFEKCYPKTAQTLRAAEMRDAELVSSAFFDPLRDSLVENRNLKISADDIVPQVGPELRKQLLQAVRVTGIEVIASVAQDSEDDIVRQEAYKTLFTSPGYEMSDLPMLCDVYIRSYSDREIYSTYLRRAWISPDFLRKRVGLYIVYSCGGTVDEFYGADELNLGYQSQNPRKWLVRYLERVRSAERFRDEQLEIVEGAIKSAQEIFIRDLGDLELDCCDEESLIWAMSELSERELGITNISMLSRIAMHWAKKCDTGRIGDVEFDRARYAASHFDTLIADILKLKHDGPAGIGSQKVVDWQMKVLAAAKVRYSENRQAKNEIERALSDLTKLMPELSE